MEFILSGECWLCLRPFNEIICCSPPTVLRKWAVRFSSRSGPFEGRELNSAPYETDVCVPSDAQLFLHPECVCYRRGVVVLFIWSVLWLISKIRVLCHFAMQGFSEELAVLLQFTVLTIAQCSNVKQNRYNNRLYLPVPITKSLRFLIMLSIRSMIYWMHLRQPRNKRWDAGDFFVFDWFILVPTR